ncbi:MAG: TlyA family RNA methyltransferase [Chloroflexi bacterium]|nr:TlyA family RNA methyltransferase [Chloroflexota bacterium]
MSRQRVRLDQLLVQRGLAETRTRAQALIMAGQVRVANSTQVRAGDLVASDAVVVVSESPRYASRGGFKLAHALETFGLDPTGRHALDVGASTGGFTDVLLQRGARLVHAVDVGYGLLDWRLRNDPRVVALDRTNIRYLAALPPQADDPAPRAECAVIDVAFISLALVLPAVVRLLTAEAWLVALVKPQFEAGAARVGRGGVVRDPRVHAEVIRAVAAVAADLGLVSRGLTRSPITGPAGNVEFLLWLAYDGPPLPLEPAIARVLPPTSAAGGGG